MHIFKSVENTLLKDFPDAKIILRDMITGRTDWDSSLGDLHLEIFISSNLFNGISKLEQHRMVMNSLSSLLKEKLHAVKIKTSL